jgi:hypothetical protein
MIFSENRYPLFRIMPCLTRAGDRTLVILRRAVLHAEIGVAALGRFALHKRVVGALLRRSSPQAEIVMHVLGQGRRAGQRRS